MTGHGYEETGVPSPARNWQSGVEEGLHREVYAWTESGGINSNFFRKTRGGIGMWTISPCGQRTSKRPMVWASMRIWRMTSKGLGRKCWWYREAAETFLVSFAGTTSWNTILHPIWLCLNIPPNRHWDKDLGEASLWSTKERREKSQRTLSYQRAYGCGHLRLNPSGISWESEEEYGSESPRQRTGVGHLLTISISSGLRLTLGVLGPPPDTYTFLHF